MFKTLADVKKANKKIGQVWFSPDTMKWFDSKIESELIAGRFFVTSEKAPHQPIRTFTVRQAHSDGTIETFGEFNAHTTLAAALIAAHEAVLNG